MIVSINLGGVLLMKVNSFKDLGSLIDEDVRSEATSELGLVWQRLHLDN